MAHPGQHYGIRAEDTSPTLLAAEPETEVWLAGRFERGEQWHVLGVFSSRHDAIAVLRDKDDFAGPLLMDEYLGHEVFTWPDVVYGGSGD